MSLHKATMKTEVELLVWDREDMNGLRDFVSKAGSGFELSLQADSESEGVGASYQASDSFGLGVDVSERNYITYSHTTNLRFHTREEFHEQFTIKDEVRFHGIEGQRVTGLLETATFIETITPDPEWVFDGSNPRPYNDVPRKLEGLETRVGYDYNSNNEAVVSLIKNRLREDGDGGDGCFYGHVDAVLAEKFAGVWILDGGDGAWIADDVESSFISQPSAGLCIEGTLITKDYRAIYIGEVTSDEADKYLKAWNNR